MTRTLRIEPRGELFVVIVNGMERPCSSLDEAQDVARMYIRERKRVDRLWRTEYNDKSKPGRCQYEHCNSVATDMFAGIPFCGSHAEHAKRVDMENRKKLPAHVRAEKERKSRKRREALAKKKAAA